MRKNCRVVKNILGRDLHSKNKMYTVDVTKKVGKMIDDAGYGDDSNNEKDIRKAGTWDVLDALSGKDNSKFSKEEAMKEAKRRGL